MPIGPPIRCFASTYPPTTQARPLTSNTSPSYLPCVFPPNRGVGILFYFILGKPILCLALFLSCAAGTSECVMAGWNSGRLVPGPWSLVFFFFCLFVSLPARVERRDKVNRRSSSIWNACLMCRGGGSRSESKDPLRRW